MLVLRLANQDVGGRVEPEEPVDSTVGVGGAIEHSLHAGDWVSDGGQGLVALAMQVSQGKVSGSETLTKQRLADLNRVQSGSDPLEA